MSLVLDAGAFVAIERGDRLVMTLLKTEVLARRTPITHGGVVGQVWRGGPGRQARLAKALAATTVVPLDVAMGKRIGLLLAKSRKSDVVDAGLVLLAVDGDVIVTSDASDLVPLANAAGLHVDIVSV